MAFARTLQVIGGITCVGGIGKAISLIPEKNTLPDEFMIYMPLSGQLKEKPSCTWTRMIKDQPLSLRELEAGLRHAEHDSRIKAIVSEIYPDFSAGSAQIEELRSSVSACSPLTIVLSKTYDHLLEYYLASGFDRIMLSPFGHISTSLPSSPQFFLRDFLKKLGVEYEDMHVGTFKSAPERFTRCEPSDAVSKHNKELMARIQECLTTQIYESRIITEYSENFLKKMYLSSTAVQKKLVDRIGYTLSDAISSNEMDDLVETTTTVVPIIDMATYIECMDAEKEENNDSIAIIYMNGEIHRNCSYYRQSSGTVDNTTYLQLKKAKQDPNVKSIIVRMNTPGGDVIASDLISKAIDNMDKPVVISMSDVAASGGYWIACAADHIVAHNTTLTGSIGVFSGKFIFKDLLDKIGVKIVEEEPNLSSPFSKWTEEQRKEQQQSLDHIYSAFTERVLSYRDISSNTVSDIAEGRVWTGCQALDLGLIDSIGGYREAIRVATHLGKISGKPTLVDYIPERSLSDKMYDLFGM